MLPAMMAQSKPGRRMARGLLAAGVVVVVFVPALLAALALETAPRVPPPPPPDTESTALSRELAGGLQALLARDGAGGSWSVSADQIDAALVSLGRVLPEARAALALEPDRATLQVSAGPPQLPGGLWLNGEIVVAGAPDGLEVTAARIGRLPLPAGAVLPLARRAGDHVLGDGAASLALRAIGGLEIDPAGLTVRFKDDPDLRTAFFARLREGVRTAAGDADSEAVYVHLWYIARAVEAGDLPREGSMLPYLQHTLTQAARLAKDDPAAEIRAGLLALALYCGDGAIGPLIGVSPRDSGRTACAGTTLGGRDDLKRHFTISAGVEAARAGQAAVGLGELKELLDSNAGGTGFSFDDMAANLAGVRFAQEVLAAGPDAWIALAEAMDAEADVLPPLKDLPAGLSAETFRERFGGVDGAEYAGLVAEIERRVDALPLYRGPPPE